MLSTVDEKVIQFSIVIAALAKVRGEATLKQNQVTFNSAERNLAIWIDSLKVFTITHYTPHAIA